MNVFPDTPALKLLKSDAKELYNQLLVGCPAARERFARRRFLVSDNYSYVNCLKVLAAEHGDTLKQIIAQDQLLSQYLQHCVASKYWSKPFEGGFRRSRFVLQFDALIEAMSTGVPLAQASERRGVDFTGFHFSSILLGRIPDALLWDGEDLDFSYLQAPGSLVDSLWIDMVSKLRGANFRDAKFYSLSADPAITPGLHCYMVDFTSADLRGTDLRRSYLRGSIFRRAKLDGADFRSSNLHECDFTRSSGAYVAGKVSKSFWFHGLRENKRTGATKPVR